MGAIASQITSLMSVYSTVYSDADQRRHQSSVSLAFVRGIHRDRWIPRTNGQLCGKCFHLMTSSCPLQNVKRVGSLWDHMDAMHWTIARRHGINGNRSVIKKTRFWRLLRQRQNTMLWNSIWKPIKVSFSIEHTFCPLLCLNVVGWYSISPYPSELLRWDGRNQLLQW